MPFEIMLVMLTTKIIAAAKLVEVPGFFVRIIPSAKAIFSTAKLNLKRNNIHNLSNGVCVQYLYSVSPRLLLLLIQSTDD